MIKTKAVLINPVAGVYELNRLLEVGWKLPDKWDWTRVGDGEYVLLILTREENAKNE